MKDIINEFIEVISLFEFQLLWTTSLILVLGTYFGKKVIDSIYPPNNRKND